MSSPISWILWVTFINSCSLNSDVISPKNPLPIIKSVQTIRAINGKAIATSSFLVGEEANFIIVAIDLNKDVDKLYIKGFAPGSPDNRLNIEERPVKLKPHNNKINSYTLPEPINVRGPSGKWRIDVQIEDKEKHISNVYTLYVIVH